MWHASVAAQGAALPESSLRELAHRALDGVGDASLGEWYEKGERAVHLRRRLSVGEQRSVGSAVDVRGTDEQIRRAAKVQCYLPAHVRGMVE